VGKALEQGVLSLYETVTGRKVMYCDQTFHHPTMPFMAYTPDALVYGEKRGVDAKVVFFDQRHKWGDTVNDIPERVVLQGMYYMAAMDFDYWDVCALIGEEKPRVYQIQRDREAERIMLELVDKWYRRYLLGDEIPPPSGSEESTQWLQRQFPRPKRADLRPAEPDEVEMLEELIDCRVAEASCTKRRDQLENLLRGSIAEDSGIKWDGGTITWRKNKDSEKTDWKDLAIALGILVGPKDYTLLFEEHTRIREGPRVLRLNAPRFREEKAAATE
jgi:predicted phage-related endonuclease